MGFSELLPLTGEARREILARHRAKGVAIPCEDGVVIAGQAAVAPGAVILPGTILLGAASVGAGCVIGPNCLLEDTRVGENCSLNCVQAKDAEIGPGCEIGPWVRLRPGAKLGAGLRIGNFVEIKNSEIGDGTKISHLSYIGDAAFGRDVNVGCGLAVANYGGTPGVKHRTAVGDGAFIGCNNSLVAPVEIGAGAYTAAGSVITEDVPEGALAIARARQVNKKGRG
ncbi:MAG: UDP-N-acetylglucosamine diphosphorylase [Oscillospiraceae bacterium]|jgi:bifunctional UDP-N-acetylglucosamine pyrophosphorylase/glucosamine-1-phosphate N-acetyltransferase|nr:UDP-N-acetylglucosamine diphosphorylase [Oscillospiraceae bacterium]